MFGKSILSSKTPSILIPLDFIQNKRTTVWNSSMKKLVLFFCLPLLTFAQDILQLAQDGKTGYVIVQSANPIPAEEFAAAELSSLLKRSTGAVFPIQKEVPGQAPPARAIFVGATDFAVRLQMDLAAAGPDQWFIRSTGEHLVLCGGRPRGTLYAVYEFLEQELGCRWFDQHNEFIPKQADLSIKPIDKSGEPWFRERHIYTSLPDTPAYQLFRTRIQDTRPKPAKYGFGYGLGTHTAWTYSKNFPADKPEYLAMNTSGERPTSTSGHGPGQICLTHPGAREHVLEQLRQRIRKNRQDVEAAGDGREGQRIFAINQNDTHFICQCPTCQALSEQQQADSGVLVDFINYLADHIKAEFPEVLLETWAYSNTIKPPKDIRPRENVLIRVIQLNGEWSSDARGKKNWEPEWYPDLFRPRSHPVNRQALELLLKWGRMSQHLGIWGYWLQYSTSFPSPYINLRNIHQELKLYKDCKVTSIFIENEGAETTSFFALKNWTGWKLMQNPDQDLHPLINTFVEGYYGQAADIMLDYLNFLEDSIAAVPSEAGNLSALKEVRRPYLTPAFFLKAVQLLDQAEAKCPADSPELLNVRRERIPVDAALYAMWGLLNNQLPEQQKLPWNQADIRKRYEQYRLEQMQKRAAPGTGESLQKHLQKLDETATANLKYHIVPPPQYGEQNLLKNADFSEGLASWRKLTDSELFISPVIDPISEPPIAGSAALRFTGAAEQRVAFVQNLQIPPDTRNFRLGGWIKTQAFDNSWQACLQAVFSTRSADGKVSSSTFSAGSTPYQIASTNWSFYGIDFQVDGEIVSASLQLLTSHPSGEKAQQTLPNTGTVWFAGMALSW